VLQFPPAGDAVLRRGPAGEPADVDEIWLVLVFLLLCAAGVGVLGLAMTLVPWWVPATGIAAALLAWGMMARAGK
jgi:membrane protein YdbS with pleckstrin-like domain